MNAGDFTDRLAIDHLDGALDEVAAALDVSLNGTTELVVPARRMLNAGGKRLRPLLTIASAVACKPAVATRPLDGRVRRGAASVELVHVGSLVHDDIMDGAVSRRGVPTINAVEGSSQALLVGDFLLARAGVEAAHVSKDVAMSLAVTIADLCDGQSLEALHQHRPDRSVDDAIESIRGKTGALMRAACEIGALCVGATDLAPALAEFGMNFGISFQLIDDLLDLLSTDVLMGKPVNNDVKAGVYTVPMLFALERSADPTEMVALMQKAASDPSAADRCRQLVLSSDAVTSTIDLIQAYNIKAVEALSMVPPSQTREGLAFVPQGYMDGIIAEKVETFSA